VSDRLRPTTRHRRQDPQAPRDGADAVVGIAERVPPGIRRQEPVERFGSRHVAERLGHVRQQAQAEDPFVIAWHPGEVVGRQGLEDLAGSVLAAQLRVELRENRAQHQIGRKVAGGLLEAFFHLLQPRVLPAQGVPAERAVDGLHPTVRPLTQREGARDQRLRVGEPALEESQRGLHPDHVGLLRRLSELLGEAGLGVGVRVHPGHVSPLQPGQAPVVMTLQRPLLVPGFLGRLDELGRDGQPVLQVLGPPDGRIAAVQRVGERGRVAEPPGHLDSPAAHRVSRLALHLVAHRLAGQTGHHLDAEEAVLLPQGR
jgi:hypothetical protein